MRLGAVVEHKVEVGTNHAERLVDYVATSLTHNDLHNLVFRLAQTELDGNVERLLAVLRDFADDWRRQGFDVFASAHRRVDDARQIHIAERDCHAEHKRNKHNEAFLGRYRSGFAGRRLEQTSVVDNDACRQLVFFTLLQQIEIKFFLNLLLTLYRQQLLNLAGIGADLPLYLVLPVVDALRLNLERADEVVDRVKNGLTHHCQLVVQVGNQRVAVATTVGKALTLKEFFVIFSNLQLDVVVVDAGIGGKQVECLGFVDKIFANESSNRQLIVDAERLVGIFHRGFRHASGFGADVEQTIAALKLFDVGIDQPEFLLNNNQSLVDKLRCIVGRFVHIANPFFVVDVEQRVENIFGTLGVGIGKTEVDNRRLLVGQRRLEALNLRLCTIFHRRMVDVKRPGEVVLIEFRRADNNRTHWSFRSNAYRNLGSRTAWLAIDFYIADRKILIVVRRQSKRKRRNRLAIVFADRLDKLYNKRRFVVPIGHATYPVFRGIRGVDAQAFNNALHQYRRAKRLDFVIDVNSRIKQVQIRERGKLANLRVTVGVRPNHYTRFALKYLLATAGIEKAQHQTDKHRQRNKHFMCCRPSNYVAYLDIGFRCLFDFRFRLLFYIFVFHCRILKTG